MLEHTSFCLLDWLLGPALENTDTGFYTNDLVIKCHQYHYFTIIVIIIGIEKLL